jgi:hypothetical protein
MFRRSVGALTALLVLLPLLSACTVPRLTSGTITLRPSLVLRHTSRHHGWNAFPTCSYSGGLQLIEPSQPGVPYVGHIRSYADSFCWEQAGEVYQVLIQFDLSELTRRKSKIVVSADLKMAERVVTMRAGDGADMRGGGTPSCLGTWAQPDADPSAGNPWIANGPYTPNAHSGGTYRVTSLVSSWVTGASPNTGIVLRGEDLSTATEDNAACVSALSDFSLTIQYRSFSS